MRGRRPLSKRPSDYGEWIRQNRERLGLSQRRLAREIGLSPGYISQLENGTERDSGSIRHVSPETARKFGEKFGVEEDEALTRAGYIPDAAVINLMTGKSLAMSAGGVVGEMNPQDLEATIALIEQQMAALQNTQERYEALISNLVKMRGGNP